MKIQFKNYLPEILKTSKYADLIDVWQDVIYDGIKKDIIDKIISQYDIDQLTTDDIFELFKFFGYTCTTLSGYTATDYFLKKELYTLLPRIKTKTTKTFYQFQGIPYNLISNAYNLYYDTIKGIFIPNLSEENLFLYGTETLDREEYNLFYQFLVKCDQNNICDFEPVLYTDILFYISGYLPIQLDETFLDEVDFGYLDSNLFVSQITKNILFVYEHKFVENENEFLNIYTLQSLYNSILQFTKITDRIYFAPKIVINTANTGNVVTTPLYDYTYTQKASIKSIVLSNDLFTNVYKIRFGKGTHTNINSSIQDVNDFYFEKLINDDNFHFIQKDNNTIDCIMLVEELQKFDYITEFIILDNANNPVVYVTFPKIQWLTTMFGNIAFKVIINE